MTDIAIIGAGPAGLSLAAALSGAGFDITLIEKQPLASLADPAFDGREIALTQASVRRMQDIGQWRHVPAAAISPLARARVLNGASHQALLVTPGDAKRAGNAQHDELGFLVPNHEIRRAAYRAVEGAANVTWCTGTAVRALARQVDGVHLTLDNGETLAARLAIAADSRFSETRRAMGIGADIHDFGRSMMVCRMALEADHERTAWEWFGHGQTLALLPLNGNEASVVVTLPHTEIQRLLELGEAEFNLDMARRYEGRLGAMRLTSTRHAYPLVAAYAERFVAERFACVGDAAVGMHPVTAHGFNLGIQGAVTLAARLRAAGKVGEFASRRVLEAWEREHRAATRPLYLATNAIARLYVDENPAARLLRDAALGGARRLPMVRRALAAAVSGQRDRPPLALRLAAHPAQLLRRGLPRLLPKGLSSRFS